MAIVAAVTAIASLGYSVHSGERSASKQREAGRVGTASQKISDRQALRQRQRETRIRQSQMMQSASNSGIGTSSGAIGAVGSLDTQYAALRASQTGQQFAAESMSQLNNSAAQSQFKSQIAGQVSGLAFNALTQTKGFQNLFAQ